MTTSGSTSATNPGDTSSTSVDASTGPHAEDTSDLGDASSTGEGGSTASLDAGSSSGTTGESSSSGTDEDSLGATTTHDTSDSDMASDTSDGDPTEGDASSTGEEPGVAGNLIQNGGFEEGTTHWVTWGAAKLAATSVVSRSGVQSGWVYDRGADWQSAVYDITALVEAGGAYNLSIWARLDNVAEASVKLVVQTTCEGSPATYTVSDLQALSTMNWAQISNRYTAPICTFASVHAYVDGATAGVSFYIDDFVMTAG